MNTEQQAIGLVGLGLVGRALAHRLSIAGYTPIGFDRRDKACSDFAHDGGRVAASLAELGQRCDRVVLSVFDTTGVLEVVDSLLASGTLRAVIDCSTGDPDALSALAARLAARGVDFIEAPLSGSSQQIQQGEATMLLGADAAALQRHGALLDALASRYIAVGGPGTGARAKLATNLVLGLNRAALAEGLAFAESTGLDLNLSLAVMQASAAYSRIMDTKGERMIRGEFAPDARLSQHLKDVQLIVDTGRQAGLPMPLSAAHRAVCLLYTSDAADE